MRLTQKKGTSSGCLAPLISVLVAFSATLCDTKTLNANGQTPRVILILVDGVRWDYLEEPDLPGFSTMAREGVKAEYVVPIMPANSYPNWYTIVTGLYAESHGFVQNYMYDEKHDDYFEMAPNPNASLPHWWNHAEPIWITSEKHGLRTAMYWWDGCQVEIFGAKPSICEPYKGYWNWQSVNNDTKNVLSSTLTNFQMNNLDFAMVYFEAVDAVGHGSGPDSMERRRALKDADTVIKDLLDDINYRNLQDQVNVVVVSDHGMTDTASEKVTVIDIEPFLKPEDIHVMLDGGSFSMLRPYKEKVDEVYNTLKGAKLPGLKVYKKEELPELYHLKNTYLTQPLVLTADPGFYIKKLPENFNMKPLSSRIYKGNHGYDPLRLEDMRAIFLATGPGLKKGYLNGPVNMVDHYNVLCRLLGIPPRNNNGRLEAVQAMFSGSAAMTPTTLFLVPNILAALNSYMHY